VAVRRIGVVVRIREVRHDDLDFSFRAEDAVHRVEDRTDVGEVLEKMRRGDELGAAGGRATRGRAEGNQRRRGRDRAQMWTPR
jgi:hypothetical protein